MLSDTMFPGGRAFNSLPMLFRVTKKRPCPVCNRTDWCEVREDGAVHCMREQSTVPSKRGGGWWHNLPDRVMQQGYSDQLPVLPSLTPIAPATGTVPAAASPEDRDHVYRALLEACPLSKEDSAYLDREGIPASVRGLYGTLSRDRRKLARRLQAHYGKELLRTVPGLYEHAEGWISISAGDGLLLAVCDATGYIVGVQCRSTDSSGKKVYRWLSSGAHEGPASGSPAHVAYGADSRVVYITEGQKKAEVVAAVLKTTALGMPGHSTQSDALVQLTALAEQGTLCVVIALDVDSDPATAARVEESRRRLVTACFALHLAVRVAHWAESAGKGIDDVLRSPAGPTAISIAPPDLGLVLPAEGTGTSCRCAESTAYRTMTALLRSPLPDAEKLVTMGLAVVLGPDPTILQHVYMEDVVAAAGLTSTRTSETAKKHAGQALLSVADLGLLTRDASDRDPSNDHLRLQFSLDPTAIPLPGARLPVPSRKAADTKRKRACRDCGSTLLTVTCMSCGCVQEDALEHLVETGAYVPMADKAPPTTAGQQELYDDQGPILDRKARNFRNPEVDNRVLPDSGSRTANYLEGGLSPVDTVVAVLRNEPEGLPLDWLRNRSELEHSELRQACTILMRAKRLEQRPPRMKNGAPVYVLVR